MHSQAWGDLKCPGKYPSSFVVRRHHPLISQCFYSMLSHHSQHDSFSSEGKNFNLDADVGGHDSESGDDLNSESIRIQRVMAVPGPNAEVHELRKVSAVWQLCSGSFFILNLNINFRHLRSCSKGISKCVESLSVSIRSFLDFPHQFPPRNMVAFSTTLMASTVKSRRKPRSM